MIVESARVEISQEAGDDLDGIVDFIAIRNPVRPVFEVEQDVVPRTLGPGDVSGEREAYPEGDNPKGWVPRRRREDPRRHGLSTRRNDQKAPAHRSKAPAHRSKAPAHRSKAPAQ